MVPACFITLTGASGEGENASASEDLDIEKNLTIQGAGPRRTIIDGGFIDRVFDVFAPATVTLADVMIRHGRADGGHRRGGGIRNAGTLMLNRVIVRINSASNGAEGNGGIANEGTLAVVESAIEDNSSSPLAAAGGILNSGLLTFTRSTVSRNRAFGFRKGTTGGILNSGTLVLVDSTVSDEEIGVVLATIYARVRRLLRRRGPAADVCA